LRAKLPLPEPTIGPVPVGCRIVIDAALVEGAAAPCVTGFCRCLGVGFTSVFGETSSKFLRAGCDNFFASTTGSFAEEVANTRATLVIVTNREIGPKGHRMIEPPFAMSVCRILFEFGFLDPLSFPCDICAQMLSKKNEKLKILPRRS
jgi:hypothetical protein